MTKRPITSSRRKWLSEELEAWQGAGVISAEQQQAIVDQYPSLDDAAEATSSKAVTALMGTAALMVAAGVLLLISFNWEAMPDIIKLVLVFGTIITTYVAAFTVRYQRGAIGLSNVLFCLGAIFYGCGIWLVAQVFHLNGHYPDGMWWWAVGTLPIAVCLDSLLAHALLVVLLSIWCGMELIGFSDLGMSFLFRMRWFPNGAYTLPLLSAPGVLWAYRSKSAKPLWLYVPLLTWWFCLQSISWEQTWHWHQNPIFFMGAVGSFLLIVAETHAVGSRLAIPYRTYGVLIAGAMLIPLSFVETHKYSWWSSDERSIGALMQAAAIVGIAIIGLAVVVRSHGRWNSGKDLLNGMKETARRQWMPVALMALMAFLSVWHAIAKEPYVPTLFANAAMLAFGIWLMLLGLREDRGRPFSIGVIYFLLWTTLRYFDLFGAMGGMLGGALVFFICGAFLFGMALFWKKRKVSHAVTAAHQGDVVALSEDE